MAIDISALCRRLGHFFAIGEATKDLDSAVSGVVDEALAGLGSSLPSSYETVRDSVLSAMTTLQQAGGSANGGLVQQPAQELIRLTVSDDQPAANTIDLAVRELIKQFEDQGESLDASRPGSAVAYDSGNVGTGKAFVSSYRADGRDALFSLAEVIDIDFAQAANGETTFRILGQPAIDPLLPTWPGGSGADQTTVSKTASSGDNLVTNGTFEENDDQSIHLPKGWIAPVATLGTTLKMSAVELQTVVIGGTPTSGFYTLSWVNASGQTQTTAPLAFDASQDDVQTALQALAGLGSVTVDTTGTTPNYTHTITFTGVTNPAQLTSSTSNLLGGSPTITHNTSAAGSANVFRGARAVEFASDGAQLTTIQVPVSLDPQTHYAYCAWLKCSAVPGSGFLTIDLVDGVGGTIITDDAGQQNKGTYFGSSFATSFTPLLGAFRTPSIMPAQAYLRIRIAPAITAGVSLYLDDVYLGAMTEIYTDGPSITIFEGATAWVAGDRITLTVTNDRAGLFHEWLDRVLSLRENRLLFPVDYTTAETQPDSLIVPPTVSSPLRSEEGLALASEAGDLLYSE